MRSESKWYQRFGVWIWGQFNRVTAGIAVAIVLGFLLVLAVFSLGRRKRAEGAAQSKLDAELDEISNLAKAADGAGLYRRAKEWLESD